MADDDTSIQRKARQEIGIRSLVNAPISLIIDERDSGKRIASGTATLKNLSLRGAMISDLQLKDNVVLDELTSYTVRFTLMVGPFAGLEAVCDPVRYEGGNNGFGVRLPKGFSFPIT